MTYIIDATVILESDNNYGTELKLTFSRSQKVFVFSGRTSAITRTDFWDGSDSMIVFKTIVFAYLMYANQLFFIFYS